jgi:4-amino-4-deoxy-L-arabinose transferase-like glycosyltransferase
MKQAKKYFPHIILFTFVAFLFLYKLDFPYFFTDEVLYMQTGGEYLNGNYTNNLQHPLLGKYLVGIMTLFTERSVFLFRLPFALLGVGAAWFVYVILRDEFGWKWGLVGALLFCTAPFTYVSTRMVMFEAPMHFFWLGFHYFFLKYLRRPTSGGAVLAGVFIGLSMASKTPSLVLYPFSALLLVFRYLSHREIKLLHVVKMYILSFATYGFTYVHMLLVTRLAGVKALYTSLMDTVFARNLEGKEHIVAGQLYSKSPWWYYFYYVWQEYGIVRVFFGALAPIYALIKKSFFASYWLIFLLVSFGFFQLIPLKNTRYIASIEVGLVFLMVSLFVGLHKKISAAKFAQSRKLAQILTGCVVLAVTVPDVTGILFQERTKYNALFHHIGEITRNYTTTDRFYLYGSTRSIRWYKHGKAEDIQMFTQDNRYFANCPEFWKYNYFIFDKDNLSRKENPELNLLYFFVSENLDSFELREDYGFLIYKLKDGAVPVFECPIDTEKL